MKEKIDGTDDWTKQRRDELVGELKVTPALYCLVTRNESGYLRIDRTAIKNEERYDGKLLLRTSDESLTAEDMAVSYKQLYQVERGWRNVRNELDRMHVVTLQSHTGRVAQRTTTTYGQREILRALYVAEPP